MKLIKVGYIVELTEDFHPLFEKEIKKGTVGVVISKRKGHSSGWWNKTYHPAVANILVEKTGFKKIFTVPVKLLRIKIEISQYEALQIQEMRREYEERDTITSRISH